MPLTRTIKGRKITVNDCERTLCEIWTRIMGYYRPVSDFNIGKKQEWKDRKLFKEPKQCKKN